jgi:hypothetical protein
MIGKRDDNGRSAAREQQRTVFVYRFYDSITQTTTTTTTTTTMTTMTICNDAAYRDG